MTRALLFLLATACANTTARTSSGGIEVVSVRRSYNNAHAVLLPEGTVLVDAGLERDADALIEDLRDAGVDPDTLALVVLTHGHADHAGGASRLQERLGVQVLAGAGDEGLMSAGANGALCPTDGTARRRLADTEAETYTPLTPDVLVDAPLDLATLGLRGTVTPVTGHTEGSLVLDLGDAIFVGDLVRGSIVGAEAVTHFYQCDPDRAVADVARLLEASAASTWFVGHFGPLTRGDVEAFVDDGG